MTILASLLPFAMVLVLKHSGLAFKSIAEQARHDCKQTKLIVFCINQLNALGDAMISLSILGGILFKTLKTGNIQY